METFERRSQVEKSTFLRNKHRQKAHQPTLASVQTSSQPQQVHDAPTTQPQSPISHAQHKNKARKSRLQHKGSPGIPPASTSKPCVNSPGPTLSPMPQAQSSRVRRERTRVDEQVVRQEQHHGGFINQQAAEQQPVATPRTINQILDNMDETAWMRKFREQQGKQTAAPVQARAPRAAPTRPGRSTATRPTASWATPAAAVKETPPDPAPATPATPAQPSLASGESGCAPQQQHTWSPTQRTRMELHSQLARSPEAAEHPDAVWTQIEQHRSIDLSNLAVSPREPVSGTHTDLDTVCPVVVYWC